MSLYYKILLKLSSDIFIIYLINQKAHNNSVIQVK